MKRKMMICISAAMALCGCATDRTKTAAVADSKTVRVEMSVRPEDVTAVSRSTDDNGISDVNLYIFGKDNTSSQHLYSQSATLEFECLPGNYDVYAIADMHEDMGELTARQLDARMLTLHTLYEALPKTVRTEIDIRADDGLPAVVRNIEVKRTYAKIAYNISVDESVSDIELYSVQAFNLPIRTGMFADKSSPAEPNGFRAGNLIMIPYADRFSGTFYMFENMQGTVAGIVSQKDKTSDISPDYASFLVIRATRGNKVLAYKVYLGENNTSDFNVRRNTSHTLNIRIYGENDVDTRVSGYTVDVYDDAEEANVGGYMTVERPLRISIDIDSADNSLEITAKFETIFGDASGIAIDGKRAGASFRMKVRNQAGRNTYLLTYCPQVYDNSVSSLGYRITVEDSGGFRQSFTFVHEYANTVYFHIANGAGGRLDVSQALYAEEIDSSGSSKALCDGYGCTVSAVADSGYAFAGWYSDARCTKPLSASERYAYTPQYVSAHVYALFEYVNDKIFYTSSDGDIVVPFNYDAFPGNIVSNTYENGRGVITFDQPVTSVDLEAFFDCTTLTSITLPQCLRFIGKNAFKSCPLTEITIPAAVEHIGDGAFYYCRDLQRVHFEGDGLQSVGNSVFYRCTSLRGINLHDGVELIGDWAFSFCEVLEDAILPASLKTIGDYAFQRCNNLRSVDIPRNVTSMGKSPFNGCISLENVTCHPTVPPSINASYPPFDMCSRLKRIYVPAASANAYRTVWSAYTGIITAY